MQAATEKKFSIPKDTKFQDKSAHRLADELMREDDRVVRWKKVHDLLRKNNKKARKEQDAIAKDCEFFRRKGLVKADKSEKLGLRWGVSMPPLTYAALVEADTLITGTSELRNTDKESHQELKGSNQLVKDLERAFPQYKVS